MKNERDQLRKILEAMPQEVLGRALGKTDHIDLVEIMMKLGTGEAIACLGCADADNDDIVYEVMDGVIGKIGPIDGEMAWYLRQWFSGLLENVDDKL